MSYTIEDFWIHRLKGTCNPRVTNSVSGWTYALTSDASYVQAGLRLRDEYDDLDQGVWLIGAPGAVGKSTLAKEICAATGAVYLDLASAATVAGNYMVGGLVYAGLLESWKHGQTAIVIDALDEARLRVTQSGFEAFLQDVANVSRMGKFPVVLLGRVGIIEEAWLILSEPNGLHPPIFDIELFNSDQAERFIFARLRALAQARDGEKIGYPHLEASLRTHGAVYEEVIRSVVARLKDLSSQDGDRFVGYAPVLDAVAKLIATESNPSSIGEEVQRVFEGEVLLGLSDQILQREKEKLVTQLRNSLPSVPEGLYEIPEQLERLGARLFGVHPPPIPSQLSPADVSIYEHAVNTLLPQHPFLDGAGSAPSSAVFSACIVAYGLKSRNETLRKASELYAGSSKHTPNPFLNEFFEFSDSGSEVVVPAEQVGLIFESVLARAKPGEIVRLSVEEDSQSEHLSVEITVDRGGSSPCRIEFLSLLEGSLKFGRKLSGVSIDAPSTAVEIGSSDQLELVAPIYIAAKSIFMSCNQLVVKGDSSGSDGAVVLEAQEFFADPGMLAPVVRGRAVLQVSWPDADAYPWTQFAAPVGKEESPIIVDGLRALRRIVMAFRSHSKGRLARFKDKIEHQRMLKGRVGEVLLSRLQRDGVISLEGPMYFLDPDALGRKVGASFMSVNVKRYSDETRRYIENSLRELDG